MNKLYRVVLPGVKDDHSRLYGAHIIRKVQELKRGMIHFVDPEIKLLQSFLSLNLIVCSSVIQHRSITLPGKFPTCESPRREYPGPRLSRKFASPYVSIPGTPGTMLLDFV